MPRVDSPLLLINATHNVLQGYETRMIYNHSVTGIKNESRATLIRILSSLQKMASVVTGDTDGQSTSSPYALVSVSLRERYIRTIYQKKATIFECSIRAFLYIVILYKHWGHYQYNIFCLAK